MDAAPVITPVESRKRKRSKSVSCLHPRCDKMFDAQWRMQRHRDKGQNGTGGISGRVRDTTHPKCRHRDGRPDLACALCYTVADDEEMAATGLQALVQVTVSSPGPTCTHTETMTETLPL